MSNLLNIQEEQKNEKNHEGEKGDEYAFYDSIALRIVPKGFKMYAKDLKTGDKIKDAQTGSWLEVVSIKPITQRVEMTLEKPDGQQFVLDVDQYAKIIEAITKKSEKTP